MKLDLNGVMMAAALLSAAALVGCGGGNSDASNDSGVSSALGVSAPEAVASDASAATDTSVTASTDGSTDSESMASALRYRRSGSTSWKTSAASKSTSVATTTAAATTAATATTTTATTVATTTSPTTTVATTTATQASAAPTAVKLSWVSPATNAQVSGMQTVALSGQAFKNVEIFSAGVKIATATVSSDSMTAVATIDTTKLANGAESLTAHAWNSAAGTAYTSDADAGTLSLVVSNTTPAATTAASAQPAATTAATTATTTTAAATTTTAAATSTSASTSTGTLVGVNIHTGGGNTSDNQKIADVMNSRQLKTARMDFNRDLDLTSWRDQVTRLKAYGIKAETSLQTTYQWDTSCNQNLSAVEADAYAQTVVLVQRISDLVQDFELLNEVPVRPDTSSQVAPFQAAPASAYAGKSCYATMASVLRGMSRAIVDQRNASGAPLKIILGTVGNDFGFLTFMQQQGVTFDVVGYHVYPSLSSPTITTDPWYGTGGPLAQLAQFNKPVRINEFNCGEIYATTYDNIIGSVATVACLASIQKNLKALMTQKIVTLESVHAYELTDQPGLAGAEARFGLMYDLNTPKSLLAAYALFSGGTVSSAEKTLLSTAGVTGK